MGKKLKRGTVIYGYAGGLFGRDSYDDKLVIESGYYYSKPWAILANDRGGLYFISGSDDTKHAKNYRKPEPDYE